MWRYIMRRSVTWRTSPWASDALEASLASSTAWKSHCVALQHRYKHNTRITRWCKGFTHRQDLVMSLSDGGGTRVCTCMTTSFETSCTLEPFVSRPAAFSWSWSSMTVGIETWKSRGESSLWGAVRLKDGWLYCRSKNLEIARQVNMNTLQHKTDTGDAEC